MQEEQLVKYPEAENFDSLMFKLRDGSPASEIKDLIKFFAREDSIGIAPGIYGYPYYYKANIIGDLINVIAIESGLERQPQHNSAHADPEFREGYSQRNFLGYYLNDSFDKKNYKDDETGVARFISALADIMAVDTERIRDFQISHPYNENKRKTNDFVKIHLPYETIEGEIIRGELENGRYPHVLVEPKEDSLKRILNKFLAHKKCNYLIDKYIEYVSDVKMIPCYEMIATRDIMNSEKINSRSVEKPLYSRTVDEKSGIIIHNLSISDDARDTLQDLIREEVERNILKEVLFYNKTYGVRTFEELKNETNAAYDAIGFYSLENSGTNYRVLDENNMISKLIKLYDSFRKKIPEYLTKNEYSKKTSDLEINYINLADEYSKAEQKKLEDEERQQIKEKFGLVIEPNKEPQKYNKYAEFYKSFSKPGTSLNINQPLAKKITDIIESELKRASQAHIKLTGIVKDCSIDPTQTFKISNLPVGMQKKYLVETRIEMNLNEKPKTDIPVSEIIMASIYKKAGFVS